MSEPVPAERLVAALEKMAAIRLVEQCIARHYPEQKMRCPAHLCLGQEGTAAAFGVAARTEDAFFGSYRSHGHYLAKGGSLVALFAELLGFESGCSGGIGGSMHLLDESAGFLGSSAIVASTVPIAAGAALGFKIRKESRVAIAFFGDAALEEGVVHETVNFSVLHRLPVVFVCENNGLAVTTPLELRSASPDLYRRFEPLGLPGERVRGDDLPALLDTAARAIERARRGEGPAYVECTVTRMGSHVGPQIPGPVDLWVSDAPAAARVGCPLGSLAALLQERRILEASAVRAMHERISKEVEQAFALASSGKPPSWETVAASVLGSPEAKLPAARPLGKTGEGPSREPSKLVNPF